LTAILVIVYFVVVHVIEGDVVGPRIMGKAVGIHPAVAIIALVAGSELFGIWGALFGAPLAGLIQAFAVAIYREIRLLNARDAREVSQAMQAEEDKVAAVGRSEGTAQLGARNMLTTIARARQRLRPSEKK
ncbi:MAG: AI-2E family transporter, partial [Candidatus Dormibacteraeota bacterium]|nr:AI-2E family transporter [Candidatus Dormibacteraeota bacterium]